MSFFLELTLPFTARFLIIPYDKSNYKKKGAVFMELHFPDVSAEQFDVTADWLVKTMDDQTLLVTFEGQGKNADLEVSLSYQDNPKQYAMLSIGELIQLPIELFIIPDDKPYQPPYDCFL